MAVKTFRLDLTPERAAGLAAALDDLVSRSLNHPAITTPLAAGLELTTPWLAQTYVPAESLDGALRQFGPAPLAHVVTIATHLAGALDFAAAAGVLHGSLHPRDVLVAPGETFLIDTGVAPALERCGVRTPVRRPYTAPELVDGAPLSRGGDVFALAAITFELLTGSPITGAGDAALGQLPEIADADPDALRATFASALALDPGARPAAALTFASSLKSALGAAGFRNAPAVPARRTPRSVAVPTLPLDPVVDEAAQAPPDAALEPPAAGPAEADAPLPVAAAAAAGAPLDDREAADPVEQMPRDEAAAAPDEDFELRPVSAVPLPVSAERPRFTQLEEPDPVPPAAARPLHPTRRPVAPLTPRPPVARRDFSRSLPAAVLLVVLAAALAGFGIGWLWSDRLGAPSAVPAGSPAVESAAAAGDEASAIGSADPAGAPAPSPAASSGVDPSAAAPAERPAAAAPAPSSGAEERAEPARGRLLVRSSPAGAAVQVNGRARGQTPLTLRDLPFGSHTVVVSRPGYAAESRTVRLTRDNAARSLQLSLREEAPARAAAPASGRVVYTGSMVVDSRPRAARVVLNGQEVGRTPLTLPSVRAGSHVVRLEMDGYQTWTASVRVVAGERNRVSASLEQMP